MSNYYYKKVKNYNKKPNKKILGILITIGGIFLLLYVMLPLISWQVYFAPVFASQNIEVPIPKTTVITPSNITSLISTSINSLGRTDYTNAQNWFPNLNLEKQDKNQNALSYMLSIPSLGVYDATVSTVDYDLAKHLVNYPGTQIPPRNGNSVVFGHSTLPQLFNPKDYKTIFATLYKIKVGNEIFVKSSGVLYKYRVYSIIVVDPQDTSIFSQSYDDSYLTLVTCTPPGTTWKRLIVKSRLEKI